MIRDIFLFEIEQRRKNFLTLVEHSKHFKGNKFIDLDMDWLFRCGACLIKDNYHVFKIKEKNMKKFVQIVYYYCPNCKKNRSARCSIPESMFIFPKIRK
ncbi:hypothetical protein LCGC14_1139210 [marine sediment metagenome]|uniref:Uncharacterized protein n=1 Tax=marine sediment metagenome TaxID=412755 RepID=A0A0F9Q4K6_9ZZZZ